MDASRLVAVAATSALVGCILFVDLAPAAATTGVTSVRGAGGDREVAPPASFARTSLPVAGDGRLMVMVELESEPAVLAWARELERASAMDPGRAAAHATAAARAQLSRIEQEQLSVVAMVETGDLGGTVIYRVQRVYNGLAVHVDPAALQLLRALPGVKAVHPLPVHTFNHQGSVPLIGVPSVWQSFAARGEGIRVGIIDSGIDYIHKNFGGSGNYVGQVYDDSTVPWTAKVVGGWDFAGDNYNAGSSDPAKYTPAPDGDPMDCGGHGSHVAGSVGGLGVNSDGSTFTGPWGTSTPFSTLRIGPGVAPQAQLYALKIFGCSGSTNLSPQAMEWAVDPNSDGNFSDHLDVINMSIGSPFGGSDDASAVAADTTAMAGVIVVCSAGNSGDTHYITGSPGSAGRALSTAASLDSWSIHGGFTVTSPAGIAGNYPAEIARFGPDLSSGDVSGQLAYPSSGRDACAAFSGGVATELAGKIALIDRGGCTFEEKAQNSQVAGAIGMVLANNSTADLFPMADSANFSYTITIPCVMTSQSAGATIKSALGSGSVSAVLTRSLEGRVPVIYSGWEDTVADFSSRGPRLGSGALKPEITAPGESIFSAATKTGADGVSFDGTSMASPHAAGVMALLRQLHPTWTVEELKALAMNTADDLFLNENHGTPVYGPARVGGGRIDVPAAAAAEVVVYDATATGQVGVTFGVPGVLGMTVLRRTVAVVNKGSAPATFTLSYVSRSHVPGASISFPNGSTISVPAGGSTTFPVELTVDGSQYQHVRDATMSATQSSVNRHWISEETGSIVLSPMFGASLNAASDLRLPVYAAPRPVGAMVATEGQIAVSGATSSGALHLTGHPVDTGSNYPTDVTSLLGAFELTVTDPNDGGTPPSEDMWDIAYVGVASDYNARVAQGQGLAETVMMFGVAMHGDWSTPNETFIRIDIDVDRNATTDFYLYGLSYGDAVGGASTDSFIALLCPTGDGSCSYRVANALSPSVMDTSPFNTNVIVLPVGADRLGLSPGFARFNYTVKSFAGYLVDSADLRSYDPTAPGLQFYGTTVLPALFFDREATTLPYTYNQANATLNNSTGALLLHLHNGEGNRAQALPFVSTSCSLSCTATVPSSGQTGNALSFQSSASATGCGSESYDWDFGDGSAHGTTQNASHAYATAGSYQWKLTVTAGSSTCYRTGIVTVGGTSAPGYQYVLGAVAHNAGVGGSQWRMGVGAVNRSAAAANLTITYYGNTGTLTESYTLASGAAVEWLNVLEDLFSLTPGTESQGTIHIASDMPVVVAARTYNQGAAGTFGQYIPALTTADAIGSGMVGVLPHLKKNASFRTNLGLVNVGTTACTVAIKLFAASGAQIGSTKTLTVEAGRWFQQSDIFGSVGAGNQDIAYATVDVQTAGCQVWAYGSVVDAGTNDPTTIPVLVGNAGELAGLVVRALGPRSAAGASHGTARQPSLNRDVTGGVSRGNAVGSAADGAGAMATAVLLQDDFEAATLGPAWDVYSTKNSAWGLTTYRASEGTQSVWCAAGGISPALPGGPYPANLYTLLVHGPLDLSDASAVEVVFDAWLLNADSGDEFCTFFTDGDPLLATDGGGYCWENTDGWQTGVMDTSDPELLTIFNPLGRSDVWVWFTFESNSILAAEGSYVDNVAVAKTVAGPTCAVQCSASVPASVHAGVAAAFTGSATLTDCVGFATYDWGFGDSTAHSPEQSPSHAYTTPGTYTWTLTVTADGVVCTKTGMITVTAAPTSYVYVIGGIAHNAGAGGSIWYSDGAVVNLSGETAQLTLMYHFGGTTVTRTYSLAAGATVEWRNILESLFGLSPSAESQGTVHVISNVPLHLTARTYNQSPNGSFGQYLPALLMSEGLASGAAPDGASVGPANVAYGHVGVVPQLKNNTAFRCNLGAVNLSSDSCQVKITLRDQSGAQLGAPVTLTVGGKLWLQRNNIFSAAAAGTVDVAYATVEVLTPDCEVWAYASVVDNGTSDPTTIPAIVQ